jgi:hypothetical protein
MVVSLTGPAILSISLRPTSLGITRSVWLQRFSVDSASLRFKLRSRADAHGQINACVSHPLQF